MRDDVPDQASAWNAFVSWVGGFNRTGTAMDAPIACGKNIKDFDLLFAARMNALHCKKKDKTVLFNRKWKVDLDDLMFVWFENEPEPVNYKMDTLRPFFGFPETEHHNALVDCRETGELIMMFLRLKRALQSRRTKDGRRFLQFEGRMAPARASA
jgi:hypothetical protein